MRRRLDELAYVVLATGVLAVAWCWKTLRRLRGVPAPVPPADAADAPPSAAAAPRSDR